LVVSVVFTRTGDGLHNRIKYNDAEEDYRLLI
jgi:hypothetical protein